MKRLALLLGCTLLGSLAVAQQQGGREGTRVGDALNESARRAAAYTQLTRGNWVVGGTGTLGLNVAGDVDNVAGEQGSTTFGLNGFGGYFFTDQFVGGLNLAWNVVRTESAGTDLTNSTFSIGPFVRYYLPVGETFAVYPQANIGFGGRTSESAIQTTNNGVTTTTTVESDDSAFTWGLGVGGAVFIGDQVSVDLFLGYNVLSSNTDVPTAQGGTVEVDTNQGTFGANIGFSIFF